MTVVAAGLAGVAVALGLARSTRSLRTPRARTVGSSAPRERVVGRLARLLSSAVIAWRHRLIRRRGVAPSAAVDWVDGVARRLRAGDTLRAAVEAEVPADALVAELTRPIRAGLGRGQSLHEVLSLTAARLEAGAVPDRAHLELVLTALDTAGELGGSAATALERVGETLRLRAADLQERSANSAQARMSANVLTVVPLAVVAVLAATDPAVRRTVTTAVGATSIALGLLLNGAGAWWMRRIIGAVR